MNGKLCRLYVLAPDRGTITLRCECGWQRDFTAPVDFGTVDWDARQHSRDRGMRA